MYDYNDSFSGVRLRRERPGRLLSAFLVKIVEKKRPRGFPVKGSSVLRLRQSDTNGTKCTPMSISSNGKRRVQRLGSPRRAFCFRFRSRSAVSPFVRYLSTLLAPLNCKLLAITQKSLLHTAAPMPRHYELYHLEYPSESRAALARLTSNGTIHLSLFRTVYRLVRLFRAALQDISCLNVYLKSFSSILGRNFNDTDKTVGCELLLFYFSLFLYNYINI